MHGKRKIHSWDVRWRAFRIWQNLGFNPWQRPKETRRKGHKDFYKGAFDSIPFLNDDAKRTFVHLLLRPGYMIRDYINGKHEIYLAPLTSLIVFYAFFALISSILQPIQQREQEPPPFSQYEMSPENQPDTRGAQLVNNTVLIVRRGWILLHLDQYPDEVDTQREASLAAFEGALRSQGIPLFIGDFLFLWLAMCVSLRRYGMARSAYAAAAAYILCQFCFFMLFAVLFSWGKKTSIDAFLMGILLTVDYHQWLDTGWKKSIWLTISTGMMWAVMYGAVLLLISSLTVLLALFMG
ncbi:MAG: DUF3667 domain-containing protein [Bacteroidales bacterium]|nr:DUF3667 domain-containing protein [Bacteroidales bacterium]